MVKPVGWNNNRPSTPCRFGFKPDDIVETPLGKQAKLVFLRHDEMWDALYLDTYIHLAGVVLNPKLIHKARAA